MDCLHCQRRHTSDGRELRPFCRLNRHVGCDRANCTTYHPGPRFCNDAGMLNLAYRMVRDAMKMSQPGIALAWCVIGGMDRNVAESAIAQALSVRAHRSRTPRSRIEQREYKQQARYSQGRRCPFCGDPITNTAQSCRRHRNHIAAKETPVTADIDAGFAWSEFTDAGVMTSI